jgi:hypothetical protein
MSNKFVYASAIATLAALALPKPAPAQQGAKDGQFAPH